MTDLNNHLFMQLERLGDEDLTAEQLAMEVERTKSISTIATKLAVNAKLQLDAQKIHAEGLVQSEPKLLG